MYKSSTQIVRDVQKINFDIVFTSRQLTDYKWCAVLDCSVGKLLILEKIY